MAKIQIVSPEELAARVQAPKEKGRRGRRRSAERTRIIEEFKQVMQGIEPGYGGDVMLAEGEEKLFVRQNLIIAAAELGIALEFRPIRDRSRIHFRVITLEERERRPKRSGRPRKQRPEEQDGPLTTDH